MQRTALITTTVAVAMLAAAPAAQAAAVSLTVTGASGKDEITVDSSGNDVVIRPATPVTVTGTGATCSNESDALTGRPIQTRCRFSTTFDFIADSGGGDDALSVDLRTGGVESVTVAGGAGNDSLSVSTGARQTVRGGDGDDTLLTGGHGDNPATLDGGAGRDLLDYGSGSVLSGGVPAGVIASLATNRARWVQSRHPSFDFARNDTLAGIERLSGTAHGDLLEGGTGADELIGEGGPDDLDGGSGNDTVLGGDGDDLVAGGIGTDTLDGGKHVDTFRPGTGGDTIQARDGFAERMACSAQESVINDLVDGLDNAAACRSVSTAAAKHRFDTLLTRKPLRVGSRRRVGVRIACTRRKPESCAGVLALRLGGPTGRSLALRRYRLSPGRETVVRLALSAAEARRVRGRRVTLEGKEIDSDGRNRRVLRRTEVRR